MRRLFLFAALMAGIAALPVMADAADAPTTLRLGIKGYDPVAYFTLQRATPGQPQFEYSWDEHVWRFASPEHRELFKADPVRYAPQFANFCAVALARGEVREANPEYWLISEGKLYLFGKSYGPDVFRKELRQNIERARQNRQLLKAQEPGR
jgi:YHS domain-containing protein